MAEYTRLRLAEREEMSIMLASGASIRTIANHISRVPSTVSRELRRHKCLPKYTASYAEARSKSKRHKARKNKKLDTNLPLRKKVFELLEKKWSPEQIAKRLKRLYPNDMSMHISHESIYTYIYVHMRGALKKTLIAELRRSHRYRQKKGTQRRNTSPIKEFVSIEQRPAEVENRQVPGHWEGDLIVGARNASAIATLIERMTRITLIFPVLNQMALVVRKAFEKQFAQLPEELKKSLTYDQGEEMVEHKLFTKNTNIKVYFAHIKSPWERGSNENTNGLIRQYFPRGTDFRKIKTEQLKFVQNELNDRPRKVLDWATPHEAFSELLH